ncbi:hypothetical protein HPB47_025728 [Ixodes persulcatus]|uniref:Uncharacterized protein n=1 Tax=Ixodes persulcatus TaxID=34615 RepID=A0AC60Q0Q3_IXOPE|nr:hypothetical protein HPB47_025728 [Ixodes persulcatus]
MERADVISFETTPNGFYTASVPLASARPQPTAPFTPLRSHWLARVDQASIRRTRSAMGAHQRFKMLAPELVAKDRNAKLPMDKILNMPELEVNPFRDRICKVFSSSNDGNMTFEDFLDMMSVFSDKAPRSVKTEYAFQIFDFNGDDMLSPEDLRQIISRLTQKGGQVLQQHEIKQLIENILKEADLDEDRLLAYAEFEHAISKAPDFMK